MSGDKISEGMEQLMAGLRSAVPDRGAAGGGGRKAGGAGGKPVSGDRIIEGLEQAVAGEIGHDGY